MKNPPELPERPEKKAVAVLDADCTGRLIAAGRIELVRELFGHAVMPTTVQKQLLDCQYTREWATHPPKWVFIDDPKEIDPKIIAHNEVCEKLQARGAGDVPRIDPGEAEAISLAKQLSKENSQITFVLSNDGQVREFLNADGANQRVFAANFWSVCCQAGARGLIDFEKERPELEKVNMPGRAEQHRDHVLEMDSPSKEVQQKGFTPMEKIDLFEGHLKELRQREIEKKMPGQGQSGPTTSPSGGPGSTPGSSGPGQGTSTPSAGSHTHSR